MTVEVRHLRALVAVAETASFTTAAATLRTSQPTLSRTIQQLERHTGTHLVHRTTRDVTLTPAGERLADRARAILTDLDHALDELDTPAPLRIAADWAGFGAHTVDLVHAWRARTARGVHIRHSATPVGDVRAGRADAAVLREPPVQPWTDDVLRRDPVTTEQLVLALPADHPLAPGATVPVEALADATVALCRTASTIGQPFWDTVGLAPETVTVPGTEEWMVVVALGDALGITTEGTAHTHRRGDVVHRLLVGVPEVQVSLVSPRRDAHPQVAAFTDLARECLQG